MKEKILISEDEKELAKAIKMILTFNQYDADVVYNGQEAVTAVQKNNYDVIIMDIMMPVMDGLEALKTMRSNGVDTPVILLTAKSQVEDKVEGLDTGANDYLTKPFDKKELLARIRALIRVNSEKKEKYDIGNVVFNKENSEISNDKASYHLNNKECEIIEYLVKNKERRIPADELSKKVWDTEECTDKTITMYMSYIQNKFNALGAGVWIDDSQGYKLFDK